MDNFQKIKIEDKEYYIIEINKAFEHWIYSKIINESKLDLKQYSLPSDQKAFYKFIKELGDEKIIRKFFTDLINSESQSLKTFVGWINTYT